MAQSKQPENLVEQTLKDVFSILFSNATNLTAMDVESEAQLREIAQRCPLDHGFGVYTARAALLKLDTLPKHYFAECERVPAPQYDSDKRTSNLNEEGLTIYPNPNAGIFAITYSNNQLAGGTVRVFDPTGRQVFSQLLFAEGSAVKVDLSNLNSGLYMVEVEVDGQEPRVERLSILK